MKTFPGYYRDVEGKESALFTLEGMVYTVTIRGVQHSSEWLDELEPEVTSPCAYGFTAPVTVVQQDVPWEGELQVDFSLSTTRSLTVQLQSGMLALTAHDNDTYFETVLARLIAQLPPDVHIR